jgi:hypothetical protein
VGGRELDRVAREAFVPADGARSVESRRQRTLKTTRVCDLEFVLQGEKLVVAPGSYLNKLDSPERPPEGPKIKLFRRLVVCG